jgi:hypothetical protein
MVGANESGGTTDGDGATTPSQRGGEKKYEKTSAIRPSSSKQ